MSKISTIVKILSSLKETEKKISENCWKSDRILLNLQRQSGKENMILSPQAIESIILVKTNGKQMIWNISLSGYI